MVCIERLKKEYPDVFKGESLLYIGATPSRWTDFLELFNMTKWKPTVLEIDHKNVESLKNMNINVVEGDVRNIERLVGKKSFDVVVWEDGPEHIYESDFDNVIPQLLNVAKKYVIMECPEGFRGHDQNGPLLERQLSGIYLNTFDKYGIKSFLLPQENKPEALRVFSIGIL